MLPRYQSPLFILCLTLFISAFSSAQAAPPISKVEVVKPMIASNSQTLRLSGSLTAERHSLLSPRVDGLVINVNVDAGSKVKKGDVLLKLDPALSQHQLAQAKANVAKVIVDREEAQRLITEAERLRAKNHISASELSKRKSVLALNKSELLAVKATQANIEETLRRHTLPAPYSGVISNKMTEAGEWISRGDAVLELVNLDVVRLDLYVPQERFADITQQTHVTVIPDSYPDQQLTGHIQAIVPVSDAKVRAFLVRVQLDNKVHALLPGTSATAEFHINPEQQSLILPRDALLHHPDGHVSVFVIEEGKALRRQVVTGKLTDTGVSILSGINADHLVVIRGNEMLQDQQIVDIINADK